MLSFCLQAFISWGMDLRAGSSSILGNLHHSNIQQLTPLRLGQKYWIYLSKNEGKQDCAYGEHKHLGDPLPMQTNIILLFKTWSMIIKVKGPQMAAVHNHGYIFCFLSVFNKLNEKTLK